MKDKLLKAIKNPAKAFDYITIKVCNFLPIKLYLSLRLFFTCGTWMNWRNPKTFNEKLQWLKVNNRNPNYTKLVDKYAVKEYVAGIIGEDFIIPTLGVWNSFDEIDFDSLPNQFVLKCTHDSGGLVICKDKSKLDIEKARAKIERSLKTNYYNWSKEWPYKNVLPRIIAEKYMEDESGYELKDYKFFCFDGTPKALFIAADRGVDGEETKFNFYDTDFNLLPFTNGHPNSSQIISKPKSFELMKELASKLSEGMPHVRIDFYDIYGKIYFGEITFYHWSGFTPFVPIEWDYKFGEWLKLSN